MRAVRWCTFVLVVVEAALLVTGRIALGQAVLFLVCVEVVCAAAVLSAAGIRYRQSRRSGQSSSTSAADAANAVLPGPIFRLVAREAELVTAVARWLLRRPIQTAGSGPGNAVPTAIIVGDTLTLGVAGSTRIALRLASAFPIRAGKAAGEVRTILVAADEPAEAALLIRSQLTDVNDNAHTSSDIRAADYEH